MSAVPTITLNNGVLIPQMGFGVFLIQPADTKDATMAALEIGYRHIDTAQMYGNEAQVGEAVRASGIDRDDIFVTSKLNNGFHAYDDALDAFDQTLKELAFDYLDLFLVHWPLPGVGDYVETWKAMEEIYRSGRCRAVGVSNFQKHHLQRLFAETEILPAVNQIEVHPYLVQDELRAFNSEHGIATEAWSPLGRGAVLEEPTLVEIARRHDRTPAQVTLRWALQRGDIVFPKSVNRHRMEENFDVFGFELSQDELDQISALNRDERIGPDPDTFNYVP
jgi:2,5-diketo-D-gluconate reductase A